MGVIRVGGADLLRPIPGKRDCGGAHRQQELLSLLLTCASTLHSQPNDSCLRPPSRDQTTATMLHLAALALLTFTFAVSITGAQHRKRELGDNCTSDNFNQPWILRDVVISQASSTNAASSNSTDQVVQGSIHFCFIDQNEDLEMRTRCTSPLLNGATPDHDGRYIWCSNQTVGFKYTAAGEILLERLYTDPW